MVFHQPDILLCADKTDNFNCSVISGMNIYVCGYCTANKHIWLFNFPDFYCTQYSTFKNPHVRFVTSSQHYDLIFVYDCQKALNFHSHQPVEGFLIEKQYFTCLVFHNFMLYASLLPSPQYKCLYEFIFTRSIEIECFIVGKHFNSPAS